MDAADASVRRPGAERVLVASMLALMGLGVALVASASMTEEFREGLTRPTLLRGHLTKLAVALLVFVVGTRLRPLRLYQLAPFLWLAALAGLVAVLFVGSHVKGASRWLDLGPFNVQPSEVARLAVIVALGAWATANGAAMGTLSRGVLVPLVIVGVPAVLVLVEPDFGSTVYLLFMAVVVLWLGGARSSHLMGGFLLAMGAASIYGMNRLAHVGKRVAAFGDPEPGSQVWQAVTALGAGGVTGTGLGRGQAAQGYVPEAENDFILAVLGEELGLLGSLLLVALYITFLWSGLRVLASLRTRFALVVGAGLLFQVVVQAILNIAVVTGSAPPKGLPLPFVSAGGTSLLVLSFSVGLLLGLARRREEDPADEACNDVVTRLAASLPGGSP